MTFGGLPFAPVPRLCKQCGKSFTPRTTLHTLCSQRCLTRKLTVDAAKEKHDIKDRKQALKTIAELIAEAQTVFNAFIRARDEGLPCICCGKPMEPQRPGGSVDAGHYLSRGASSHLRFNEDNCFAQRKSCNRPGGATRAAFREGVLARIGAVRLDAIECDYRVHKWDREELIQIRTTYARKLKELKMSQHDH